MFEKLLGRLGYVKKPEIKSTGIKALTRIAQLGQKRAYQAAQVSNLLSDWTTNNNSADIEMRLGIRYIRNRMRDLERNDDYTRKILRDFEGNVIGHQGFRLMMKMKTTRGDLNRKLNESVETAYKRWRQRGNYDVTGMLSGTEGDKLILRQVVRDGEAVIRYIRGFGQNDFKFAFQFLESDQLDENYVWNFEPNIYIRMGVEMDEWRRPQAYHFWKDHPGDLFPRMVRIRVPADEVLHPYLHERVGQSRGISWMCSSAIRLRHLSMYEQSEVVAARVASAKMAFIERTGEEEFQGDGQDDSGNIITEANPGMFEKLPINNHVVPFDPQHPNGNYPEFRKAILRGVACGVGVSYNTAFGDLEGVNYSSLRGGELDERDMWLGVQEWFKSQVKIPEFRNFLQMAIISGQLKGFSVDDVEDIIDAAHWRGRRWPWVDPQKDIQANIQAVNGILDSRSNIIESQGRDREEVFEEIAEDNAIMKELGIQAITDVKNPIETGKSDTQVDDAENVDTPPNSTGSNGKNNQSAKKAVSLNGNSNGRHRC